MRCSSLVFLAAGLVAVLGTEASAQKTTQIHPGGGGSPHVMTEWTIDGAHISIEYGRPHLKGRTVGGEVAPFGKVWRTGADEATTLKSDKALTFGSLTVPAGTHTLYTLPGKDGWQLIVSKKTGQWGIPYPEGNDLGRAPMTVSTADSPVELMTISIEDTDAGATLSVEWGNTKASIPFKVG